MVRPDKLDFWFRQRCNVLFRGRHGVGKTAVIKQCFERHGLTLGETYLYFSAATLDPWVDFVGVPKERVGEDGVPYLDLVRPRQFAHDRVEAIFVDEFNRAPKKVRNAVMELIQFKSINGKVFSNLKVVWAAVNPGGDDGYDVDEIDPAQLDRFHITVDVPYAPDQQWFADRFGFHTAKHALAWWHGLPDLEKDKVSPRRLEYALTMWCAGGDLRDVVPASANVGKLTQLLAADILPTERLQQFYLARNAAEAEAFLANENNYVACTEYILGNAQRANFFLPLLTKERLSTLAATHTKVCNRMCAQSASVPKYAETLDAIVKANQNYKLARYVRRKLEAIKTKTESEKLADLYAGCPPSDKADPYHSESPDRPWRTAHDDLRRLKVKTEQQAAALYEGLLADLPQAFVNWSDVCNALGLLNNLVTPWWAKTVMPAKLTGIVNMINHCLAELQRLTSVSTPTWHDFFKYYKGHWNTLFRYLADTNQATWVRPPHVPETKGDKA